MKTNHGMVILMGTADWYIPTCLCGWYSHATLGTDAAAEIWQNHMWNDSFDRDDFKIVEDEFGSFWERCSPACDLQVVRPGKAQCSCEGGYS